MMDKRETIKIALALSTLNHDWTEEPSIDEVVDAIMVALDAMPQEEPTYKQINAAAQTINSLKLATDFDRAKAALISAMNAKEDDDDSR